MPLSLSLDTSMEENKTLLSKINKTKHSFNFCMNKANLTSRTKIDVFFGRKDGFILFIAHLNG
jgi:hypothetical protein